MIHAVALDHIPHLHPLAAIFERVPLSRPTVYRAIKSGALKARRIGGQWFLTTADIETFLAGTLPACPEASRAP
jgi:excisionase family DNA binding protein